MQVVEVPNQQNLSPSYTALLPQGFPSCYLLPDAQPWPWASSDSPVFTRSPPRLVCCVETMRPEHTRKEVSPTRLCESQGHPLSFQYMHCQSKHTLLPSNDSQIAAPLHPKSPGEERNY